MNTESAFSVLYSERVRSGAFMLSGLGSLLFVLTITASYVRHNTNLGLFLDKTEFSRETLAPLSWITQTEFKVAKPQSQSPLPVIEPRPLLATIANTNFTKRIVKRRAKPIAQQILKSVEKINPIVPSTTAIKIQEITVQSEEISNDPQPIRLAYREIAENFNLSSLDIQTANEEEPILDWEELTAQMDQILNSDEDALGVTQAERILASQSKQAEENWIAIASEDLFDPIQVEKVIPKEIKEKPIHIAQAQAVSKEIVAPVKKETIRDVEWDPAPIPLPRHTPVTQKITDLKVKKNISKKPQPRISHKKEIVSVAKTIAINKEAIQLTQSAPTVESPVVETPPITNPIISNTAPQPNTSSPTQELMMASLMASQQALLTTQVKTKEVTTKPIVNIQPDLSSQIRKSIEETKIAIHSGFVEAFDWQMPISLAQAQPYTVESHGNWWLADAPQHFKTLFWSVEGQAPLISFNAAQLLGHIADVQLKAGMGIVFGVVGDGWSVDLSGRTEKILYFDRQRKLVSSEKTQGERSFVLLNAEPGAHLVYLSGPSHRHAAVMGAPVLPDVATFLDLRNTRINSLDGKLFSAETQKPRPIGGVSVQVIGQPEAITFTTIGGEYSLDNVLTAYPYPLYLQVDGKSMYTHRYRLTHEEFNQKTFFHFSNEQVSHWLNEIEGGVSPNGGVVVGALPDLVKENNNNELLAGLFPTLKSVELVPETYALNPQGLLQVNQPLSHDSFRFVSLQVPDGAMIVNAENRDGKTVWSQIVFSSPGVISVVGPY